MTSFFVGNNTMRLHLIRHLGFWISLLFKKKKSRSKGILSWNAYEMSKIHEFLNFDQEDWKKNYRFTSNR